jgi:hypothetical protein
METTGFTWIISGKGRDTHKGSATLKSLGYLKEITKFDNVLDNLITEVVPSKERLFPMVDFVDTPGLTDGGLIYPYDIDKICEWIADKVDLIFVFFDPHGQALCERTRRVVQAIASHPHNKIKLTYFLTKIDTFKTEQEKSKVMIQLSQSLTQAHHADPASAMGKQGFGNHALSVLGIFLPHKADSNLSEQHKSWNELDELCSRIDTKIKETVQSHCEKFENHATKLRSTVDRAIQEELRTVELNNRIRTLRTFSLVFVAVLPVLLLSYLLHAFQSAVVPNHWKQDGSVFSGVLMIIRALASVLSSIDGDESSARVLGFTVMAFLFLLAISRFIDQCLRPERTDSQVQKLRSWQKHLSSLLDPKKGKVKQLWDQYLNESVEEDLVLDH